MSQIRARYDGPYEEVLVFDSEAGVHARPIDTVRRGGLLSADVPARIRNELTAREDWTEVRHASGPPSSNSKSATPSSSTTAASETDTSTESKKDDA